MLKKLLTNILIVAIVVFVLDFCIGRGLRYFYFKEMSGLHYRTTYSLDSTKADVLIFGSSRANHNYVPEVFEDSLKKSFYNAGRDGNGIFYQIVLLQSILKRHIPKVIILEYSGEFNKQQPGFDRLSSLLPYYRNHEEVRTIIKKEEPIERIKLLSEIYPFNSQVFTIGIGNLEMNRKRTFDNKGYVPLYREWQSEIDSAKISDTYELDSNKVNTFKEFIETAKNLGIRIFVVSSPIFQKLNTNLGINECTKICSAENVPFWNFQKDTSFLRDKSLFQDIFHLNNKGAIEFSKMVAGKILHDTAY